MKSRSRVNKYKDRKIYKATAKKVNALNIPGRVLMRGGIRL